MSRFTQKHAFRNQPLHHFAITKSHIIHHSRTKCCRSHSSLGGILRFSVCIIHMWQRCWRAHMTHPSAVKFPPQSSKVLIVPTLMINFILCDWLSLWIQPQTTCLKSQTWTLPAVPEPGSSNEYGSWKQYMKTVCGGRLLLSLAPELVMRAA